MLEERYFLSSFLVLNTPVRPGAAPTGGAEPGGTPPGGSTGRLRRLETARVASSLWRIHTKTSASWWTGTGDSAPPPAAPDNRFG